MQPGSTTAYNYPSDDFDLKLLRDGAITLFRKQAVLVEAVQWLSLRHYQIRTMDAATWQDEVDFHRAVAEALDFPDYYGQNLAALDDSLWDFETSTPGDTAIVFLHYDAFASRNYEYAQAVLDAFAEACWNFLVDGHRLLLLIQSDEPFIQLGSLGGREARWNPREWFNKDRV